MDRDALTAEVADVIDREAEMWCCAPEDDAKYDTARAVLDHLHPVIVTAEELDALPVGAVVMDRHGDTYQKRRDGRWFAAIDSDPWMSDEIQEFGPITLLYRGQP